MKDYLQQAIFKEISIGGKFFCWHDWIYLGIYFPQSAWEYAKGLNATYLCTQCGKRKNDIREAVITRYNEKNHLFLSTPVGNEEKI